MNYIIWLVISVLFFAVGEYYSKKFAISPRISFVVLLLAAYLVGELLWLPAIMQKNQLSIVGVMWSVMSVLATALIGFIIFKESLSLIGVIGMALAIISIILLGIA